MNEANVWWINIITNIGIAAVIIGVIKWLGDRFINNLFDRLKQLDDRIKDVEERQDSIKEHFTDEIEKVVEDKNNYRIKNGEAVSEIKAKVEIIMHTLTEIKNKIFK